MGVLITDKVNLFVLCSLITNYKLACLPSPQARHLKRCQTIKLLKVVITVKYTTKIKSLHRVFFCLFLFFFVFFYARFCSLHLLNHNSCLTTEQECLSRWYQLTEVQRSCGAPSLEVLKARLDGALGS